MKQRRRGAGRRWIVFAAAVAVTSLSVGQPQAYGTHTSTVTAVSGSAFGYYASVSLFGGPATARGPAGTTGCDATSSTACSPSVSLPSAGGSQPAAEGGGATAQYGPAVIFEAASMDVSTQGTTGAAGAVTSTASAGAVGPGPFTAEAASSTCTASGAGVTASTAIVNGRLVTKTDPDTGDPVTTEAVPAAPEANTAYTGTLDHVGDGFKAVFNEQTTNPDGSITVNALHLYMLGPIAVGELIVGQSVCGVTSTAVADAAPSTKASRAAPEIAETPAPAPAAIETGSPARVQAPSATPPAAASALPTQTAGTAVSSTCTGSTGSTTIVGGTLRVSEGDPNVDGDDTNVPIPTNPAPNTRHQGKIEAVGDSFEAIFNEQIVAGGGITVNAYHLRLLGPTAVGDLIIGQSRCGPEAGAFGYKAEVSLFGGPAAPRGPAPTVSLPPGGSQTAEKGEVVYGPATLFSSGPITVSAQGSTSKVDIQKVNVSESEVFTATGVAAPRPGGTETGGTGTAPGTAGTGAGAGARTPGGAGAPGAGATQQARPGMATTGFGGVGLLLLAITLLTLGTAAQVGGARLRLAGRTRHPADAGS